MCQIDVTLRCDNIFFWSGLFCLFANFLLTPRPQLLTNEALFVPILGAIKPERAADTGILNDRITR